MYIEELTTRSTVTEIQIAINKAINLYHQMVGWLYKSMLADEINDLFMWRDIRKRICSKSELDCYNTFIKYNLL